MTVTTKYALPEGCIVSFESAKVGETKHCISISFSKGKNEEFIIKDCEYRDSYVEVKTYMDEEENKFQIICSNYRNITSFMVNFSLDIGRAVLMNRLGWLDCPSEVVVKV